MGGPQQSIINSNTGISNSLSGASQTALQTSAEEQNQMNQALQPALGYYSALASGNRQAIQTAIAPQTGAIAESTAQNKENIYETLGPGAARDAALTQNVLNQGNQVAGLRANAVANSYNSLAGLGTQLGQFSLQELGAGINAGQVSAGINQQVLNVEEQKKASTLGFFGQLGTAAATGAGMAICWIAESLYGEDTYKIYMIRRWLSGPFSETWYGAPVMWAYRRYGQRVAAFLEGHPALKAAFRPLFDRAFNQAVNYANARS